jgi:hypothetical protein
LFGDASEMNSIVVGDNRNADVIPAETLAVTTTPL